MIEVKNAADPGQVKRSKQRQETLRDRELNDLRYVLNDRRGRRFLWRLLGNCKVFCTIWEPSAKIHYNSGMQDVGHFLQAEITEASEEAYFCMMKESKDDRGKS